MATTKAGKTTPPKATERATERPTTHTNKFLDKYYGLIDLSVFKLLKYVLEAMSFVFAVVIIIELICWLFTGMGYSEWLGLQVKSIML